MFCGFGPLAQPDARYTVRSGIQRKYFIEQVAIFMVLMLLLFLELEGKYRDTIPIYCPFSCVLLFSRKIQGHNTYLLSFFLRPAFLGFTTRCKEFSSESRKESPPSARPVRSCPRIFFASSSSASSRNNRHSPTISSSGATVTSKSSFPAAWALALLHCHAYGSATSLARTGFISTYFAAASK